MATIYNSNLSKELLEGARIQINRDSLPNQLADKVVPVMEVNPKLLKTVNKIVYGICNNSTSSFLYGGLVDKDFYLTSIHASFVKDVTATTTLLSVSVEVGGIATRIITFNTTTLTIERGQASISFDPPIKIDRGGNITALSTTNVANFTMSVCLAGYTEDNPNS